MGDGDTASKRKHFDELIDDLDVTLIGTAEATDRAQLLDDVCHRHGFARTRSMLPGASAVVALWRRRTWKRRRFRAALAVVRSWVGPEGAGPTWSKTKRITFLVLRHRASGELITVLVTHFIPSVTRNDLSPAETQARARHHAQHMRKLVALVKAQPHDRTVVVMCDANAQRHDRELAPLVDLALVGWGTKPDMHGRRIDHVLNTPTGPWQLLQPERLVDNPRSHRTIVHRFRCR